MTSATGCDLGAIVSRLFLRVVDEGAQPAARASNCAAQGQTGGLASARFTRSSSTVPPLVFIRRVGSGAFLAPLARASA